MRGDDIVFIQNNQSHNPGHQDNLVNQDFSGGFVPEDGIDYEDGGWIQGHWTPQEQNHGRRN